MTAVQALVDGHPQFSQLAALYQCGAGTPGGRGMTALAGLAPWSRDGWQGLDVAGSSPRHPGLDPGSRGGDGWGAGQCSSGTMWALSNALHEGQ